MSATIFGITLSSSLKAAIFTVALEEKGKFCCRTSKVAGQTDRFRLVWNGSRLNVPANLVRRQHRAQVVKEEEDVLREAALHVGVCEVLWLKAVSEELLVRYEGEGGPEGAQQHAVRLGVSRQPGKSRILVPLSIPNLANDMNILALQCITKNRLDETPEIILCMIHLPDKTAEEDREDSLGEELCPLFAHIFRSCVGKVGGAKHGGDACSEAGDLTAKDDHLEVLRGALLLDALVKRLDPRAACEMNPFTETLMFIRQNCDGFIKVIF